MRFFRTAFPTTIFLSTFLLAGSIANAQLAFPVPTASLCNSGRTPKGLPPTSCLSTVLVSPVNPITGGSSIDGNWELAKPYPSAGSEAPAPDPCTLLTAYGPAWIDDPNPGIWYNPNDGLSQWITPLNEQDALPGWYVYRTGFTVPAAYPGYLGYLFEVTGQMMADDQAVGIYLVDADGLLSTCREVATFTATEQFHSFTPFHFSTPVIPVTHGYLYFVVFNDFTYATPTGLRVEFATPYFYPYE